MKPLVIFFTLTLNVFICWDMLAQQLKDTLILAESVWSVKKKEMVLQYMQLSEAQKAAFWPIYNDYSHDILTVELECLRAIRKSVQEKFHESTGNSLLLLRNELCIARIRKQYHRKFRKVLTAPQLFMFMQIDAWVRAMMREEIHDLSTIEFAKITSHGVRDLQPKSVH